MRVARIVLIVVVVLGGLFVAADRVALSVAQNKAAERAAVTQGLTSKPKVSIEGFPFLTQVLFGKLDEVKVSANDIAAGEGGRTLRIDSFHADLHGVKMSNNYSTAVADSADGLAFITYADLTKAAPAGITVSYAGARSDNRPMVKLAGSFMGAELSVLSEIKVEDDDTIGLHAENLPEAFTALGLEDQVRKQIDFTTRLTHLPAGISLTSVTTTPDGISVAAAGRHVVLAS
jgi:LmeA-like phospholipid-binding